MVSLTRMSTKDKLTDKYKILIYGQFNQYNVQEGHKKDKLTDKYIHVQILYILFIVPNLWSV